MATAKKNKKQAEKPSPPPDDIKIEPFRQNLAVILKREEVEERAQRSAHLVADYDAKEVHFKDLAAENKRELARIEAQIRELSDEIRSGKTYRDVPCERVHNWTKGTVTDRRCDTGETLTERPMSEAESQKALPFPEKPEGSDLDSEFSDSEQPTEGGSDKDGDDSEDAAE